MIQAYIKAVELQIFFNQSAWLYCSVMNTFIFYVIFQLGIASSLANEFKIFDKDPYDLFPIHLNSFNTTNINEQVLYSTSPNFHVKIALFNLLEGALERFNISFDSTNDKENKKEQIDRLLDKILPASEFRNFGNLHTSTVSLIDKDLVITTKYNNTSLKKEVQEKKQKRSLLKHFRKVIISIFLNPDKPKYHISESKWFRVYNKAKDKHILYFVNISSWMNDFDVSAVNQDNVNAMVASPSFSEGTFAQCQLFEEKDNYRSLIRLVKWDEALPILHNSSLNLWNTVCPGI